MMEPLLLLLASSAKRGVRTLQAVMGQRSHIASTASSPMLTRPSETPSIEHAAYPRTCQSASRSQAHRRRRLRFWTCAAASGTSSCDGAARGASDTSSLQCTLISMKTLTLHRVGPWSAPLHFLPMLRLSSQRWRNIGTCRFGASGLQISMPLLRTAKGQSALYPDCLRPVLVRTISMRATWRSSGQCNDAQHSSALQMSCN